MTTARYATSLTGGGAGALDAKAVGTLSDGDFCFVATGTILYVYKFVAAATDAESSPSKIRPDDYSTAGVWYLQNVSADYAKMSRGDIDGGDITTSGQTITVTPTGCWDSTRLVWFETTVNKTVTASSTNNEEQYVFLVKLVSDGTCEFRRYTTYAGAGSDAQVSAYRFISWAKNNGSGVLMPYRQVGDRIDWLSLSEMPVINSAVGATYASYSVSNVIPTSLCAAWSPINDPGVTNVLYFSYDGSTAVVNSTNSAYGAQYLLPTPVIFIKRNSADTYVKASSITLRR
jgi:hypothetical protein